MEFSFDFKKQLLESEGYTVKREVADNYYPDGTLKTPKTYYVAIKDNVLYDFDYTFCLFMENYLWRVIKPSGGLSLRDN